MKKKAAPKFDLLTKLESFSAGLGLIADEASRVALVKRLDSTIEGLKILRDTLNNGEFVDMASNVSPAVAQVIAFMQSAKEDERVAAFLSTIKSGGKPAKREPSEIPANLSNQQIRELLKQDLSADELRAIAAQRAISAHGASREQLKRSIIDNLVREEGYQRLAQPT